MYTIQGLLFEIARLLIIAIGAAGMLRMIYQTYLSYQKKEAGKTEILTTSLLALLVFAGCLMFFFLWPYDDLVACTGIALPTENVAMKHLSLRAYSIIRYITFGGLGLANLVYAALNLTKWRRGECELVAPAINLALFLLCLYLLF